MNTHGHESVAQEVGRPLLDEAFGKDNRSLNAFYLGNWLTDVSQAVDPVAYAAVAGKAKKGVDKLIAEVKNMVDRIIEEVLASILEVVDVSRVLPDDWDLKSCKSYFEHPDVKPLIDEAIRKLHGAIDFF